MSITDYTVREIFRDYTFVEAKPRTGRQHQIRVHFASLGYPLAIDRLYGRNEPIYLSSIKHDYKKSEKEELPLLNRLTLHAEKISFIHPASSQPVDLTAPLPKDFAALLQQLRKYSRYGVSPA